MLSGHMGWRFGVVLLLSAVLGACDSGNDDAPPPVENAAPVASAGADRSVASGSNVTLTGSGTDSDGTVAGFQWTQTGGPNVTLAGANTATATFTAPNVAANTVLTFRLRVTDDDGAVGTDEVRITVNPPAGGNQLPTANAGADKNAVSGSNVALPGTATDTDGTIASFAWSQVSGTAVTLTNANTANASFTAPVVAANTALTFRLTVTDDDGGSDTDDITVTVTPAGGGGNVPVTGKVTFARVPQAADGSLDYAATSQQPAQFVTVRAINNATNAVIATTRTDDAGNYSLNVPANTQVRIRVLAEMTERDVAVVNNTAGDAVYQVESAAFSSGAAGTTQNVTMTSGFNNGGTVNGNRVAAPFAILDTIRKAQDLVLEADATATFPALQVGWSTTNDETFAGTDPCDADGDIGFTFYSAGELCVLGAANANTDEYDEDVLVREWGRYFLEQFARTDYIVGFPGDSSGSRLDMRVAFVEGFLLALTGMVNDGVYAQSAGANQGAEFTIDLEDNNVTAPAGWFNPESVRAILYDVYDGANDGPDTLNLGFGAIYDALVATGDSDALVSIFPFVTALKAQNAGSAGAINTLVSSQGIVANTIDAFGSTETNNGGLGNRALPIYTTLTLNAAPVTICTADDAGDFNRLGNRRFARFTLPTARTVTVTATSTAGTDPDLFLYRDGVVAEGISGEDGSETFQADLGAGTYVLEMVEFNGGDDCLNVDVDG